MTEYITIKSANPNFPNGILTFSGGISGYKFEIEYPGENMLLKFWFDKGGWKDLKLMVDYIFETQK